MGHEHDDYESGYNQGHDDRDSEIEKLEAENAQLKVERDEYKRKYKLIKDNPDYQECCVIRAQLKARVRELEGELEQHAWAYSPAMADAKINQLNEEVDKLKAELAQCQQDLKDAAGELAVPIPEAGTDMARLLSANVLLRQREARLRELSRYPESWEAATKAWEEEGYCTPEEAYRAASVELGKLIKQVLEEAGT